MSRSCNFYLSILLASTFMSPAAAMDATLALPENDFTLEYTHTNTPIPKPASLSNSYKTAAICFLGHGDCDPNIGFGKGDDYEVVTDNRCTNEGFYKNNCSSVQVPTGYCPYNSSYINGCKCDPNLIACPLNKNGTGASCGGKYQSCTCKSEYVYTSSNCTSPRSVSGSSCDGKYTGCVCPTGVSSGTYGCKTYYGSPVPLFAKKLTLITAINVQPLQHHTAV